MKERCRKKRIDPIKYGLPTVAQLHAEIAPPAWLVANEAEMILQRAKEKRESDARELRLA